MRENAQSIERASEYASVVFPTPGRSSIKRCPPASKQTRIWSMTSSLPLMVRPMLALSRARASWVAATSAAGAKSLMAKKYEGSQTAQMLSPREPDLDGGRAPESPEFASPAAQELGPPRLIACATV